MRVRLRSLMIAIAVLGVALGLWRRHLYLRGIADSHAARIYAQINLVSAESGSAPVSSDSEFTIVLSNQWGVEEAEQLTDTLRRFDAYQDWHRAMRAKYLKAASRPWLPVEPDPPEPPLPQSPFSQTRK